jgi:hypothetical protein
MTKLSKLREDDKDELKHPISSKHGKFMNLQPLDSGSEGKSTPRYKHHCESLYKVKRKQQQREKMANRRKNNEYD